MYTFKPTDKLITVNNLVEIHNRVREKEFYFAGEMHNFFELVYIADGVAVAAADDRIYNLSGGDLLIHKPMEFHRIWKNDDENTHFIIISFTATGKWTHKLYHKLFHLNADLQEEYIALSKQFQKAYNSFDSETKSAEYEYRASLTASKLECFLLKLIHRGVEIKSDQSPSDELYHRIVGFMNTHMDENLQLSDIAADCNISVSQLKKIFKMYSDCGVMEYFTSIKIRKAMEWLSEGLSTADIAEKLCFSSVNYFHTVFKKHAGVTPAAYRKKTE